MDVNDVIDRARESLSIDRVYGEPIRQDGVTLVPAAWVSGGGGGGGGEGAAPEGTEGRSSSGRGFGSGFGLNARPAGAFVLREGHVSWMPAVDANRLLRGAQMLLGGLLVLMGWRLGRRERYRALRRGLRPHLLR